MLWKMSENIDIGVEGGRGGGAGWGEGGEGEMLVPVLIIFSALFQKFSTPSKENAIFWGKFNLSCAEVLIFDMF